MAAKLSIIESLRCFLSDAVKKPQYKRQPTDFSRERSLTMRTVALLILSALRWALDVELVDFFKVIGYSYAAPTKGAFSLACYKLATLFLLNGMPVFWKLTISLNRVPPIVGRAFC